MGLLQMSLAFLNLYRRLDKLLIMEERTQNSKKGTTTVTTVVSSSDSNARAGRTRAGYSYTRQARANIQTSRFP